METTQDKQAVPEATEKQMQALNSLLTTLGFQAILIVSLILSFLATLRQREALYCEIAGETEKAAELADVFPLRCRATAMSIGVAGYFLCLALQGESRLHPSSGFAKHHSTELSILEAVLILAAALVSMTNLMETKRCGESIVNVEEEEEPL